MLRGVDIVAPFINVNIQSESNSACIFHSSNPYSAFWRSYHQNLHVTGTLNIIKPIQNNRYKFYSISGRLVLGMVCLPLNLIRKLILYKIFVRRSKGAKGVNKVSRFLPVGLTCKGIRVLWELFVEAPRCAYDLSPQ